MNKKETTISMTIVGIALLATITMFSTPTQALALGHWNIRRGFYSRQRCCTRWDSSRTTDNSDDEEGDSGDEEEQDSPAAATTDEYDEDEEDSNDDPNDKEDSSSSGYEAFQDCHAEIGESPTEGEVHDCIESSYGVQDNHNDNDNDEHRPSETPDEGDENDTDVTKEYSADDPE
jgi:hypothetical protein